MIDNLRLEVRPRIGEEGNVYGINAIIEGSLVGHAYGYISGDGSAVLESINVNLSERSKGIGCLLLGKFVDCMENEGVTEITGEMGPEGGLHIPETRRFYEKNGFSVDEDFNLRRRL